MCGIGLDLQDPLFEFPLFHGNLLRHIGPHWNHMSLKCKSLILRTTYTNERALTLDHDMVGKVNYFGIKIPGGSITYFEQKKEITRNLKAHLTTELKVATIVFVNSEIFRALY